MSWVEDVTPDSQSDTKSTGEYHPGGEVEGERGAGEEEGGRGKGREVRALGNISEWREIHTLWFRLLYFLSLLFSSFFFLFSWRDIMPLYSFQKSTIK